jgi:hypothetical protein
LGGGWWFSMIWLREGAMVWKISTASCGTRCMKIYRKGGRG